MQQFQVVEIIQSGMAQMTNILSTQRPSLKPRDQNFCLVCRLENGKIKNEINDTFKLLQVPAQISLVPRTNPILCKSIKDKIPLSVASNLVYEFECDCGSS